MLIYINNGGHYGIPFESYEAITAAAHGHDLDGLRMLIAACPSEYRGRCDAMIAAAVNEDMEVLAIILGSHYGEEDVALVKAEMCGSKNAIVMLKAKIAADHATAMHTYLNG
jgi:hypothetical protein